MGFTEYRVDRIRLPDKFAFTAHYRARSMGHDQLEINIISSIVHIVHEPTPWLFTKISIFTYITYMNNCFISNGFVYITDELCTSLHSENAKMYFTLERISPWISLAVSICMRLAIRDKCDPSLVL